METTKGASSIKEGSQWMKTDVVKTGAQNIPDSTSEGNDKWGTRHWPRLLQYMEDHVSFTIAILSIIGYVIIAAFGSMENLGQYIGYIIFLSIVGFIYNFKIKTVRWLYVCLVVILILIGVIVLQHWNSVTSFYTKISHPFKMEITTGNII